MCQERPPPRVSPRVWLGEEQLPGAWGRGAWGPTRSPDPLLFLELAGLLAVDEDRPVRVTQLLPESLGWSGATATNRARADAVQVSAGPACPASSGQLLLRVALEQPEAPTQDLQSRLAGSGSSAPQAYLCRLPVLGHCSDSSPCPIEAQVQAPLPEAA